MRTVGEDIKTWLLTQQDWLQEACDRLLTSGLLTDSDVTDVCSLLKTENGQKVSKHRTFNALAQPAVTAGEFRLTRIGEVQGIENLAPRTPLDFGTGNMVVVYGHNGSGKSSYTRILKKASGKPRAVTLKANVFAEAPAVQQCSIGFQQGSQESAVIWAANGQPIDAIRTVDIFDSDEATHYLTKESAAAYIPPMVSMFEALAGACDRVRTQLQLEQDQLTSVLPVLPPIYLATEPASRYAALRPNMTETEIQAIISWTDAQASELNALTERLKVTDPAAVARQRRATKQQVVQISDALKQGTRAFNAAGIQAIHLLQKTAEEKRRIATEGALVTSAQLDGLGVSTWRALWEAARAYSETAYPGKIFPVTNAARCLLCHQELAEDAQQRLRDFESFVQSKLEAEADAAEKTYRLALQNLPTVPTEAQLKTQCEAAALTSDAWTDYLTKFWNLARTARLALQSAKSEVPILPVLDTSEALVSLESYCASLDADAAQHDLDAQGFDRKKAAQDKLTLEARHWISQQADAVRKEVGRLNALKSFEDWKALANPRKVSIKASEIAEKVITQAFVSRFNDELKLLGASRIQVEIVKSRTDRGKVLHQLRLKGAKNGQAIPAEVLSEGERRIIALAAFLADVTERPQRAPFIFDDPISSLDHDFEWAVATRLAALAQTRQVLVFTHRLSLYGAMEDVARKVGEQWKTTHLTQLCIESYSGAAGHPVAQAIWNSKTEKANNILLDRLGGAKRAGEESGAEAYRALAQGICGDFRKLLERTVEDDLLYSIVRRHRRSVTTDNKLPALSVINADDCTLIDGLMTKYSCYEHSQSREVPVFIPEETELRQDIESLKHWRKSFETRRKEVLA
ncbi:AAA family ATPase [Comamonas sp. Z3]|uniref:AAA family ATPase n=1 Tax=Comamonas sp. Z3 TaxID=2601247 RepID=UPI0011E68CF5|nr:AAA family ATPase [Comamonas sp. Z3]TYK73419.1 AAA family ATPase [Comamonas sp. Z3]